MRTLYESIWPFCLRHGSELLVIYHLQVGEAQWAQLLRCCQPDFDLWTQQVQAPGLREAGDVCVIGEMKRPGIKLRVLELAEDDQILVPTGGGTYAPARIAFWDYKGKVDGGL